MSNYNHPNAHYAFFHESKNVLKKKYKELKINRDHYILTGTYLDANDEQRTFYLRVPNDTSDAKIAKYFDGGFTPLKRYTIESTTLLEQDLINDHIEIYDFTPAPVEQVEGTERAY